MSGENRIAEQVDAVGNRANGVAAHYEYAPFGEVTAQVRRGGVTAYDFAALNPWRFSSEYADDALNLDYYNYRHYEPVTGRWLSRDSFRCLDLIALYEYCENNPIDHLDFCGQVSFSELIDNDISLIGSRQWGLTQLENPILSELKMSYDNSTCSCEFSSPLEFSISVMQHLPESGSTLNENIISRRFLRQIIAHENKHIKISKEVAEKYLKPAEQEMSAQKAKGENEEECFRELSEKVKPLAEKALRLYKLVEGAASSRLDNDERVKVKRFFGFEYLTVEGDFDVNAFLQQFPSYDEMKENRK